MQLRNNKLRIAGVVVGFCLLVIVGAIATIAVRYHLSPFLVAKFMGRHVMLSAVSTAVSVYDPSIKKEVVFGPPARGRDSDPALYVRFENPSTEAAPGLNIQIKAIENGRVRKNKFDFGYQTYDEPGLAALRKEYKLDQVVAPAKTEFEAMVLLRNWTRSQFRRFDYQPSMRNFDAFQILRNNVRNPNKRPHRFGLEFRPCHFFPLFYSQVLLSMGYQPRLVRISPAEDKGYNGHGMTEVWSNQFEKWIAMDPDLNIYYEKDGVPLNLLEIHNERYASGPSAMRVVQGVHTAGDFDPSKRVDVAYMIQYASYIQIVDMRNDWLTNHYFRGHPRRSDMASLIWVDERMPPVFTFKPKTHNADDFYWTLDQTEILIRKGADKKEALPLALKTYTPNFKCFEIQIDDAKTITSTEPVFTWELHPGSNKFSVRSVNQFGVPGVPSRVELEVGGSGHDS